ncbi:hypothetical protein COR50_21825 [Chitinophaga caeni]|uniref:Fluoroacetyl-CoA-specific thioesterase-like domain-containing protein n=1 Tax=Chitinophaga caeni TaxID=2029983 RepID=A0A291R0B0_9BACT|nr:hypothetical protein [Chitinophaga caeni]ATL49601.1 hypothetical protein COR50_21825 [Chitinophaga caeni]
MKLIFKPGDTRHFSRVVTKADCASFESGLVHPVYATFALARDAEWCCRLFVLDMKEDDEEGIGTMLTIEHLAPALVGATVDFTATVASIQGNEIICQYEAYVGARLIAKGKQGQKILPKQQLEKIFERLL